MATSVGVDAALIGVVANLEKALEQAGEYETKPNKKAKDALMAAISRALAMAGQLRD
jgi:hypothetical protein